MSTVPWRSRLTTGTNRIANEYASNGFVAPKADLCTGGKINITIPIFNTSQATSDLEWQSIKYDLATVLTGSSFQNKEVITYEPAKVYDNLLSAAGYTTKESSVGTHYKPVGMYTYCMSTRDMSTINNPMQSTTLSTASFQFGGTVTVRYIDLNATTNCGRLSVQLYETGVPKILTQQMFMDTNSHILSIGEGTQEISFEIQPRSFNNEKILSSFGESELANKEFYGWHCDYDGPMLIMRYLPNSSVDTTKTGYYNDIVGQIVITYDIHAYNFTQSAAAYLVAEWIKNNFSTAGSTTEKEKSIGTFSSNSIKGNGSGGHEKIIEYFPAFNKKGTGIFIQNQMTGVSFKTNKAARKVWIEQHAMSEVSKQTDALFDPADLTDESFIFGGSEESSLLSQSSSSFIEELTSWSPALQGNKGTIKNGTYFQLYNSTGTEYLMSDSPDAKSFLDSLSSAPTCQSLLSTSYLSTTERRAVEPFIIEDNVEIMDKEGKVACATNDQVRLLYAPLATGSTSKEFSPKQNSLNGYILNQTLMIEASFKDPGASTLSSGTLFDTFLNDEKLEQTEQETNETMEVGQGLMRMITNHIKIDIPEELDAMPELKEKYINARKKSIENMYRRNAKGWSFSDLKASVKKVASTGYSVLGIINDIISEKPRGRTMVDYQLGVSNSKGSSSSSNTSKKLNDAATILMGSGDNGDAYFMIPENAVRSNVIAGEPSDFIKLFRDFGTSTKYYIKTPEDPSKSYFVKMNCSYSLIPNISFGVSVPITLATDGKNTRFCYFQPNKSGNISLQKTVLGQNVRSHIWPVLYGSRFPLTDSRCITCGAFLTSVDDQYQTVMFNPSSPKGDYVDIRTNLSTNTGEKGNVPMYWTSLSYQNNINISTGFFIPDKLPDEKGNLTELKAGEKMYVYVIFKIQHEVSIPNGLLSSAYFAATKNDGSIFMSSSTGAILQTISTSSPFTTYTDAKCGLGYLIGVAGGTNAVMTADGTAYTTFKISGKEYSPNKGVNYLTATVTEVKESAPEAYA